MGPIDALSRRQLLKKILAASSLATVVGSGIAPVRAEDEPLISVDDPAAKAVKYVEDVAKATGAPPGSSCANCALYQGKYGSKRGPCQIFPGKAVIAAGWCASWAPQM
jgi:hypothetical protein